MNSWRMVLGYLDHLLEEGWQARIIEADSIAEAFSAAPTSAPALGNNIFT